MGTVVGMLPTKVQDGSVQEVYKVLWFNLDEDSGDLIPYPDAAAPASHLAVELVSYVDEFEDNDDDPDTDTDTDLFEDTPQAGPSEPAQQ